MNTPVPKGKLWLRPHSEAVDWMFVSPSSSAEAFTSTVMVSGGGGLWGWLGHEGGALMNGISVLIERDTRHGIALSVLAMWGHSRKVAIYKLGREPWPEPDMLTPWSRTSQPAELWAISAVQGTQRMVLLQQPKQTDVWTPVDPSNYSVSLQISRGNYQSLVNGLYGDRLRSPSGSSATDSI